MNVKLNTLPVKNDDKLKDLEEFSKDLKRPFRGDKTVAILAYVVGALTIASILL
ncbi:hypothetical protein [Methanothermococcus okinawensis]|uniref:Uncharacterized protein n=1 Tax=Methanothermococcus okinawensis (strain DSM 14208 / JCM 11175 / IH1) TaxID=647113 RepID=F8AKI8_METOI|nr:hypothetical protein [Methanothermococcus okinawensis]AEH07517.1 hypothetical protein Metok_1554 [Methanothermococcus okinawensis IH1]